MKKIIWLSVMFLLTTFCLYSLPEFVPPGASWRIDIFPGDPDCLRGWREVSRHYDSDGNLSWGQGQCSIPYGRECHCWDWLTWWFGIAWVPDPPEGYTSIYGTGEIPIYNPVTHKYE